MITGIEHARYRLRLRAPATWAGVPATEREGLLVAVRDDAGRRGFGEIAPLPGWHRESLADAELGLAAAARQLHGAAVEAVLPAIDAPSVAFGLEMAQLGLLAQRRNCTPAGVLCKSPAPTVAVNALCAADPEHVAQLLRNRELTGYSVVKVKVGRRPADEERAALVQLLDGLPAIALRLDGNRALGGDQARRLVDSLPVERFDYFEEPLREPAELAHLAADTGIKIGLDETLREPAGLDVADPSWVAAWVVKPTLAGGFAGTLALARRAQDAHIACVISSCFESGLGLEALAQLAACTGGSDVAAGLATDRWLAEDLREPAFSTAGGSVATSDWIGAPAPRTLRALGFREEPSR